MAGASGKSSRVRDILSAGGGLWAQPRALTGGNQHRDLWHSHTHAARAADHRAPEQVCGRVCLWGPAVGDVHWEASLGWHDADAGQPFLAESASSI